MDVISDWGWLAGPAIGAAGLIFGLRRERRSKRAQADLRAELEALPGKLVAAVAPALTRVDTQPGAEPPSVGEIEYGMDPENFVAYVGYADVTNDGRPELLVLHPAGVHSSMLKVFGTLDIVDGFRELGDLFSGVAGGFEVGDFDGDGLIEIATINADFDRDPSRSYANAILVENFHRWNGEAFEHVGEGQVYDPDADGPAPPRIQKLLGRPAWALREPPPSTPPTEPV